MKFSLLIFGFLSLTTIFSSASHANLNGKFLICKCEQGCSTGDTKDIVYHNQSFYKFANDEVTYGAFYVHQGKVEGTFYTGEKYNVEIDSITWGRVISLERKTLKMRHARGTSQCTVQNSKRDFEKQMKKLQKSLQNFVDGSVAKNKI